MAEVVSVNISREKGTIKVPVEAIEVRKDHGIVGDAHADNWHRQISLLADESIEKMREKVREVPLTPGVFAENITTKDLELYTLPVGTRLRVGQALLEVTQIGKECHYGCEIRTITGDCVMPREGVFAIVLEEGVIRPGDSVELEEKGA